LDDPYIESSTWNNLGIIYTHQKKHQQALECYQKHLSLAQQIGDNQAVILGLSNLGSTYEDLGDLQTAETCFKNSLQLSEEMNDAYGIARAHNNLGVVYEKRSSVELALDAYRKGMNILATIGDHHREVVALMNIATLLAKLKQLENAEPYIQQAWAISLEAGYTDHLAALCMLRGDISFLDLVSYRSGYQWYSQACQYAAEYSAQLVDALAHQVQLHIERMVARSEHQEAREFFRTIQDTWRQYGLDKQKPNFLQQLKKAVGETVE